MRAGTKILEVIKKLKFILLIICQLIIIISKLDQAEERLSLSENPGNATKLKEGAGSKKKSGFWNCCSGGSTGSGSYLEAKSKLKFVSLIVICSIE